MESIKKIKEIFKSQSKHIKFEEYRKCLDKEEYQRECNKYILCSNNHEMHLQELKKSEIGIDVKVNDLTKYNINRFFNTIPSSRIIKTHYL